MMNWLRNLFRRAHVHRLVCTHTNQYQQSTREVCRCGLIRMVDSTPAAQGEIPRFEFWWRYSDGRVEPDERIFRHDPTAKPPAWTEPVR